MGKDEKGGKKVNIRKLVIYCLLIVGFLAMAFPGIIIMGDRIYPCIFGLPFLYGYILCCWAYMCLVLFYAYRTSWGKRSFFHKNFKRRVEKG